MKFTDNYNLNLPDLADQYNLEHWNENTEKLDLELKKETDSRINTDNQLQSNINNSVSTLRNEISTAETNAKNLAKATGVLAIEKGGTGATTTKEAQYNLLKDMDDLTNEGSNSNFSDTTPIVCAFANPNELNEVGTKQLGTIYRRNCSKLWEYIQNKISSVLGLNENTLSKKMNLKTFEKEYSSTGWKRFAKLTGSENINRTATATSHIIHIGSTYRNNNNQSLTILVNIAYQKANVTVLCNTQMARVISDVRIVLDNKGTSNMWDDEVWLEIYYNVNLANQINFFTDSPYLELGDYTQTDVNCTILNKTEVSDTYATKGNVESINDSLLKFTRITRVTPPSFASLLGARALYSEDGGLKQIIVALKANQSYNSGNATFSFSFIYGKFSSSMQTFIGGYCTTVPGYTNRLALNSYGRSQSTGECVHTIEINNAGVLANDIITVYLNYL